MGNYVHNYIYILPFFIGILISWVIFRSKLNKEKNWIKGNIVSERATLEERIKNKNQQILDLQTINEKYDLM